MSSFRQGFSFRPVLQDARTIFKGITVFGMGLVQKADFRL